MLVPTEMRVFASVEVVPGKRDENPDHEHIYRDRPQTTPWALNDQQAAENRQDRGHRIQRNLETALQVRLALPQHDDTYAHGDERDQRADAGHLREEVDLDETSQQGD